MKPLLYALVAVIIMITTPSPAPAAQQSQEMAVQHHRITACGHKKDSPDCLRLKHHRMHSCRHKGHC
jgi:uncharacterized protein YggE